MGNRATPFWNADYLGQEGAGVGYMELLPFDSAKAGTGPFRIDTAGNITAASISAVIGLAPSGDMTGVKDTAAIQAALNKGGTVLLGAGKFYVNAPLTIPPYAALVGQQNTTQVSQTDGGTALVIVAGFTGLTITDGSPVTLTAAIVLLGQTFGGYATVSEEQKIASVMIDGTAAPASVHGILSYGRLQRVELSNVLVSKVTGDGVQQNVDVAGNQPDAFYGYKVFTRFCGGKGFNLRSADSTWLACLSSNNGDTGVDWFINTTSNSKYIGCRSEHAAGLGFGYVCTNSAQSSGGVLFSGCSTDQSTLHGFQAGGTIATVASFTHAVALTFIGCVFRRDGANGGSGGGGYAGFYDANYGGQISMAAITVWPGINDDGSGTNSPQVGLLMDSGSRLNISASYVQGATTAITDNSGGTASYDNTVITATGTTGSPTIVQSPNIAAYQGKSLTLTPAASPGSDPLSIVSAASGNRAFGIVVAGGGSNDRFKVTSDGKIAFGPGSTTQDVSVNRPSAGILSVTDSGSGGSAMLRVAASASQTSATELVSAVCNASADVAYIAKVTGDTNNRFRIDSNGQQQWGIGSAALDTVLQRGAAGRLDVSTDAAGGTLQPVDAYGGGLGFVNPAGQIGMGNLPRASYTLNTAPLTTSGTIYLVSYYMPAGKTVTNITFVCGTGALWSGATHGWYVLVDQNGAIQAVSADQTSVSIMGVASTPYPLAVLTSSAAKFVTAYSGLYRLGIMLANSGGGQPNLVAGPSMATGVAGIAPITSAPCTGGTGTGQTTPPTANGSVTLTLGSADGGKNYMAYVT